MIKSCVLFLAMLGSLLAVPTQEDALGIFTKNVNSGRYSTNVLSGYPPGFVHYWINSIAWNKTYTQNFEGEEWTVFVVDAVVSGGPDRKNFQRYSVKAGLALIQRGDSIFYREPFDHVIGEASAPTAEELRKEEEAAKAEEAAAQSEEQKRTDAAKRKKVTEEVTAAIAGSVEKQDVSLSSSLKVLASLDETLQPSVFVMEAGRPRYAFRGALDSFNLSEWIAALNKWKDWAAKARSNSVTNVKKEVARFGSFPSISLQFVVDDKGTPALMLAGQLNDDLLLPEDQVAKFTTVMEKLQIDLKTAADAIPAAVEKKLAEAKKTDDLFK